MITGVISLTVWPTWRQRKKWLWELILIFLFLPCFALIFINNYYKLLCAEVGPSDKQIKSHRFTKAAPVELNSVLIVIVVPSNVNTVLNCLDV